MKGSSLSLIGAVGSPYSRKLRAVLRYRRIPHVWVHDGSPEAAALPRHALGLLPRLIVTNETGEQEAKVDSTPLIRELETAFAGRCVIPPDPALAFLDALIEDFADEWLTKAMFHYRWAHRADIDKASTILPRWFNPCASDEALKEASDAFSNRQIERLWVVGSNDVTARLIEDSYRRLLTILDARIVESRFVLGARPSACDFAIYGQLTQLAGFDPTPSAVALAEAPRVSAWTDLVDDLSGVACSDGEWIDVSSTPDTVTALFAEIGRVYVPFLLANANAVAAGKKSLSCQIDGLTWKQTPVRYQAKCLLVLRAGYEGLEPDARETVDRVLGGSGCEPLFA